MKTQKPKLKTLSVRVTEEQHAALKEISQKNFRVISRTLEMIVHQFIEENKEQ